MSTQLGADLIGTLREVVKAASHDRAGGGDRGCRKLANPRASPNSDLVRALLDATRESPRDTGPWEPDAAPTATRIRD